MVVDLGDSGSDHHDGARGVGGEVLTDRGEQCPDELAVTARADHQQLCVRGGVQQHLGRMSFEAAVVTVSSDGDIPMSARALAKVSSAAITGWKSPTVTMAPKVDSTGSSHAITAESRRAR